MLYVWVFAASVFVGGLLLLALLTVRAFRQVKHLGRTVAAASTRIGDEAATIEALAPRDRADRGGRSDPTARPDWADRGGRADRADWADRADRAAGTERAGERR